MFFGLLKIKSIVSDHELFFSITEETRLFSDFDLFLTLNGLVPLQLQLPPRFLQTPDGVRTATAELTDTREFSARWQLCTTKLLFRPVANTNAPLPCG